MHRGLTEMLISIHTVHHLFWWAQDANKYHKNLFRLGLLGCDNAYVILQVATTVQRYTMPPFSDLHHIYTGSMCPCIMGTQTRD